MRGHLFDGRWYARVTSSEIVTRANNRPSKELETRFVNRKMATMWRYIDCSESSDSRALSGLDTTRAASVWVLARGGLARPWDASARRR